MSNRRMLVIVGDSGLSCCVCDVFWSANELLCYLILHRCSGPHSVSDGSSIFADTFPIHQFLLSAVWKASEARHASGTQQTVFPTSEKNMFALVFSPHVHSAHFQIMYCIWRPQLPAALGIHPESTETSPKLGTQHCQKWAANARVT